MRIDNIQRAGNSTTNHTHDHEREEEIRPEPPVLPRICAGPTEAVDTSATQYELWDYEYHAKLRFVYAVVKAREQVGGPVANQAGEGKAEECTDEGTCIPL